MTPARLGEAIVRQTELARPRRARDRFPLTGGWIMRVARRLGHPVGRNQAYEIQHQLIESGVIEEAGSYAQHRFGLPTGFKVKLYRRGSLRLRQDLASVPSPRRRKPWWQHPAFGFGVDRYPDDLPRWLRQWKEPPER